ncbi:hypothetical protein N0V82_001265 [Gnomoniopsis sp. IMI 355080]|nr:hypothetical protein N0V82_001265 [Gnomoniopsis sp. IMI 355080]
MQISHIILSSLTLLPTGAVAWGAYGHETVAYIASNFVAPTTATYFQSLLGDTSANYLASVAAYADSYRSTTAGKFSAPFHYVDARDDPPSSCGVDFERDCGADGCVISAIANYFVGDVGQPLHCEFLDVGGNTIDVTYNGDDTNLHAIWDTQIPEAISGGSTLADAKTWANTLTTAIKTGEYKTQAASWVSGLSINNAEESATTWASESNAAVCSTVLKQGVSFVEQTDLAGSYTTTASPVVKLQIAKQGYRLAKWLDAIVAAV